MKTITKSDGLSLVELLVAGVLGLILLAGVLSLFLGSKKTYRVQDQLGNIQTDGRFAMMFIERHIENGGWYQDLVPSFSSAIDVNNTSDGGGSASDSLAIQVEYPVGTAVDCNGSNVADTVISNRFFVNGSTLLCQGNGGAVAQPIIENVESFQVLYGVDSDSDGVVNQYVTASSIGSGRDVIAIQVAILMVTNEDVGPKSQSESFEVLDETYNSNDSKIRRVFQKTIMLPNQAYMLVNNSLG